MGGSVYSTVRGLFGCERVKNLNVDSQRSKEKQSSFYQLRKVGLFAGGSTAVAATLSGVYSAVRYCCTHFPVGTSSSKPIAKEKVADMSFIELLKKGGKAFASSTTDQRGPETLGKYSVTPFDLSSVSFGRQLLSSDCSAELPLMYPPYNSFQLSSTPVTLGIDASAFGDTLLSAFSDSDSTFGSGNHRIYVTSSDISGASPVTVDVSGEPPDFTQSISNPKISFNSNGNCMLIFCRDEGIYGYILSVPIQQNGIPSAIPQTVFRGSGSGNYKPDLTPLQSGKWGVIHTFYTKVDVILIGSDGITSLQETFYTIDTTGIGPLDSSINELPGGNILITYQDGTQITSKQLNPTTLAASSFINSFVGSIHDVVVHSSGNVLIGYADGTSIKMRTVTSEGDFLGTYTLCSHVDVAEITLKEAPDGQVVVGWLDGTEGRSYGRLCEANGSPVRGEFVVGEATGNHNALAMTYAGNRLVSVFDAGGTLSGQEYRKNAPPQLVTPPANKVATVNSPLTFEIPPSIFSDSDPNQVVKAEVAGLPYGGTFNGTHVTVTAPPGSIGNVTTVTVVGNDGLDTTESSFTITVNNVPPVFKESFPDQEATATLPFGVSIPITLVGNEDPTQVVTMMVERVDGQSLGWLNWNGTALVGTPPADLVGSEIGLRLTASDGKDAATTEFSLRVVNTSPEILNPPQNFSTPVGVPFSRDLSTTTVTDADTGQSLSQGIVRGDGSPLNIAWLEFNNGLLEGTPPIGSSLKPYDLAFFGSDQVEKVMALFHLTVTNTPPQLLNPPLDQEGRVGQTLLYTPGSRLSDPNLGQPLTLQVVSEGEDGLVNWMGWNGTTFDATPPIGSSGKTFPLEMVGSDGTDQVSELFKFTVKNYPPFFRNVTELDLQGMEGTFSYNPPQAFDPDGDPITYSGIGIPEGFVIDPVTGSIVAGNLDQGNYSFSLIAADSHGSNVSLPVNLEVFREADVFPNPPVIGGGGNTDKGLEVHQIVSIVMSVVSFVFFTIGFGVCRRVLRKDQKKALKNRFLTVCCQNSVMTCCGCCHKVSNLAESVKSEIRKRDSYSQRIDSVNLSNLSNGTEVEVPETPQAV